MYKRQVIGNDTAAGGYRVIIPDPDECGTIVRAIAPGENINFTLDDANNILRINASEGGNTIGGGGGNISFNVINSRLLWDGVIRIYTQSQTFLDVVMPPNQTVISTYAANGQMTSSVVSADGILLNRSQSLYYITFSAHYNPANFRIVELGANLQAVNLNNWYL